MGTITDREAVQRFTHAGLDCALVSSGIGFVNGYVRLPEGHVGHDAYYDQLNRTVQVHGGLTYGTDSDGWVGFDTGHSGDYWPGTNSRYSRPEPDGRAWTLDRLAAEVRSLAEQLAAMTEIATPTAYWDCTEDEFQQILADALAWRASKRVPS